MSGANDRDRCERDSESATRTPGRGPGQATTTQSVRHRGYVPALRQKYRSARTYGWTTSAEAREGRRRV
eukprot:7119445-Prymnesium_polylepis.1